MQQPNQDEQSVIQSDEQPFIQEDQQLEEEPAVQIQGYSQSESGPIELIYTMFSFYRKQINELAERFDCKIRFSISSYVVQQASRSSKDKFLQCLREAAAFMRSINMEEVKTSTPQEKLRLYKSPYIHSVFEKKKIKLVCFHMRVYGFSRQLTRDAIKSQLLKVGKNILVFSVCIRPGKKEGTFLKQIYSHISGYFKLIFQHFVTFFAERQLVVTFDSDERFVMIHGQKLKFMMQAKNKIKNVIESMTCIYVKDAPTNYKKVLQFLKKASTYPVYFSPYNGTTFVLISKDNVIKQLVTKSANFLKYLGLQSPEQQAHHQPTIGFYLIPTTSIMLKIQKIRQMIQKKCYDIYTNMGIKFLKRVFIQKGIEQPNILRELIADLMRCVEEYKNKYQAIKQIRNEQPKFQEPEGPLKYQIVSGKSEQRQLSQELRRDVLMEKVQMKKKFIIAFNVVETNEQTAFWLLDRDGQEGVEVKRSDLVKGSYMQGRKKLNLKGQEVKLFEYIITVL